jgi:hypothetical protein
MNFILIILSLFCTSSYASEDIGSLESSPLIITGFVYQGLVKSINNNYKGDSTSHWGSFKDRSTGISASYPFNKNIDFRGSLESQQSGDRLSATPNIEYGLVDMHTTEGDTPRSGIRLGVLRNELGFYNATMENPVARDMDIAPQSIYRMTLSDFVNNGKGIQIYSEVNSLQCLNILLEYSRVLPTFSPREDVTSAWFGIVPVGTFDETKYTNTYHLLATTKDLRWMFRYDQFNVKADYLRGASDVIPSGDLGVKVQLFGIHRYFNTWDITYEFLKDDQVGSLWKVIRPKGRYSIAQNLVVRKVLSPNWTYYVGYNEWNSDHTDLYGDKAAASPRGLPAADYYSKDFNVGINYTPNYKWRFRGSYHRINGIVQLSPIDNPDMLRTGAITDNLYTLSATYAF